MSKLSFSHSALSTYNTCGRKYKYHYSLGLRSKVISGALLFGSAIDTALNHLLLTRNLEESLSLFEKSWRFQFINRVGTNLQDATNVVYAKKDWDRDLIFEENQDQFNKLSNFNGGNLIEVVENLRTLKEEIGFNNFTEVQKHSYNFGHWLCLKNKGTILIKAYYEQILPNILEVLTVQEKFSIDNGAGDSIPGYIDLVVRWKDGKIYVADNKTSSSEYEVDSASKSQQLILYHYAMKEKYKIDGGAGFFVMYKQIVKDRTKICTICGFNGSETKHKSCNNEVGGKRCNGKYKESVLLKGRTDVILNQISEAAENLVIEVFDEGSEAIKKGSFPPNISACEAYGKEFRCPYFQKCWSGKEDDLIVLPENKK